jgi:hypothetical protein
MEQAKRGPHMGLPTPQNYPEAKSSGFWSFDQSIWDAYVVEGGTRDLRVYGVLVTFDGGGNAIRDIKWIVDCYNGDFQRLLVVLLKEAGDDAVTGRAVPPPSPALRELREVQARRRPPGGGTDPIKNIGGMGPTKADTDFLGCQADNATQCAIELSNAIGTGT